MFRVAPLWHRAQIYGGLADTLERFGHLGKLLAKYPEFNSRLVFSLDDAAKDVLSKRLGGGYEGGAGARQALVDYRNPSNAAKVTKYVAPFANFRMGIPGAVASSIAKNPAKAKALNRLSQGTFLGGTAKTPDGHKVKLYSPVADVARGVDDPMGYRAQ